MKKETVNTFEGGLNKDLNPIVTPKNILTDCLNGAFLTFNGDELVLQNDSGNTTIIGPKDIGKVKLSEGFEPLGIKEYGGVLYIVSVRKAYDTIGRRVPSEDEIEFGSYPSPESSSYRTLPSAGNLSMTNDKNFLYKTFVINNEDFRAGRDVSFTENINFPNDISNVWRPSNPNGLYNVQLLLSLNSGTIDLTKDIWDRFLEHKNTTGSTQAHWLFDPTFNYYWPFNYRGKLLLKVVFLEPTLKVMKYHDLVLKSGWYTFKISLNIANSESLFINGYNIEIVADNNTTTETIQINSPVEEVSFRIPALYRDKQLSKFKYKITPLVSYYKDINTTLDWNDLPEEFKRNFTISNTVIVNEELKEMNLIPAVYGELNGISIVNAVMLIGRDNQPVSLSQTDIEEGGKPLVFWREGVNADSKYKQIGRFTLDGEFIGGLNWAEGVSVEESVKEYLNYRATQIKVYGDYIEGNDFIKLFFDAGLELNTDNKLKYGSFKYFDAHMQYETITNKEFKLGPIEDALIILDVNIPPFKQVSISNMLGKSPKSYKIPLLLEDFHYVGKVAGTDRTYRFKTVPIPNNFKELGRSIINSFNSYQYKLTCITAEVKNSKLMMKEETDHWYFYIDMVQLHMAGLEFDYLSEVELTAEVLTVEDGYALSQEIIQDKKFQKMGGGSLGYIVMPKYIILKTN